MAPHHEPQIHGHLVAAVDNGYMVEVFPNRARDPSWDGLFAERPALVDGQIVLGDRPGLGISLDRDFLERYRTAP